MPLRGEVYFPKQVFPLGSPQTHRLVVLSSNHVIATGGRNLSVNLAVIRSARLGPNPVRMILGHSFPVSPKDLPSLTNDSVIETHQLFSLPLDELSRLRPIDRLPPTLLAAVLEAARRLFS